MAKGKMESIVVISKAKAILKGHGCHTAADAIDGLNVAAYRMLEEAAKRAQANKRKTVRDHDFILLSGGATQPTRAPAKKPQAMRAPAKKPQAMRAPAKKPQAMRTPKRAARSDSSEE